MIKPSTPTSAFIVSDFLARKQSRRSAIGTTRRRKRPRNNNTFVSWHIPVFALAVFALASSSWNDNNSLVVLADESEVSIESNKYGTFKDNENESGKKPYRPTYGGRIKLLPNRKLIRVVTASVDGNTTPWKNNSGEIEAEAKPNSAKSSSPTDKTAPNSSLWTRASPYLKRGILLVGLTAIAVIDKSPPPPEALALTNTGAASATATAYSWFPTLKLNWNKLWGLPSEILPSLSAALMIAWIPNLVMQKAYFELAFLFCSLTTQSTLRNYLLVEVLPSMGGTARKLFWSEFWKQAWDFLLEPFPHNIMLPSKKSQSQPSSSSSSSSSKTEPNSEAWSKVSRFWSDRVVSRIDKWTASSVKAVLQRNVQASVNGLAEDSFKAVAYAWYPQGETSGESNFKRPVVSLPSNEDTARMIELECEDKDKSCNDEEYQDDEQTTPETLEKEILQVAGTRETTESSDNDNDNESLDANDSSPTVEVQEVLAFNDDHLIKEAQAVPNN